MKCKDDGEICQTTELENLDQTDANVLEVEEEIKRQEMQVAENITITQDEMKMRRFMDIRRW